MAVFNLKRTEDTKNLILLLEVGVYLHDIGKLSMYFIASKAKITQQKTSMGRFSLWMTMIENYLILYSTF